MKILALNLNKLGPAAGNGRPANLVRYFRDSKADVLVLSEFKKSLLNRPFTEGLAAAGYPEETCFATALEMEGFRYKSVSKTDGDSELGVAVFSRRQAKPVCLDPPSSEKRRITAIQINDIVVAGVYFATDLSKKNNKKVPLFEFILDVPKGLSGPSLAIGDYNAGLNCIDEEGTILAVQSQFSRMDKRGWCDLWRAKHGGKREFSWMSNAGNGFRIDHAFGRGGVEAMVADCHYDHSTRCADRAGNKLSDHSAMIVEIE